MHLKSIFFFTDRQYKDSPLKYSSLSKEILIKKKILVSPLAPLGNMAHETVQALLVMS